MNDKGTKGTLLLYCFNEKTEEWRNKSQVPNRRIMYGVPGIPGSSHLHDTKRIVDF
jgi:hypothetical protein